MNEHLEKMKSREQVRKVEYQAILKDLEKISHYIAYDQETPSPLRKDYEETLLAIKDTHRLVKALQSKIFD